MALETNKGISVLGKSWVIDLPDDFTSENDLAKDTKVLLTFKANDQVEAEVLPPLSEKLREIAEGILRKRKNLYEEMRRLGD